MARFEHGGIVYDSTYADRTEFPSLAVKRAWFRAKDAYEDYARREQENTRALNQIAREDAELCSPVVSPVIDKFYAVFEARKRQEELDRDAEHRKQARFWFSHIQKINVVDDESAREWREGLTQFAHFAHVPLERARVLVQSAEGDELFGNPEEIHQHTMPHEVQKSEKQLALEKVKNN